MTGVVKRTYNAWIAVDPERDQCISQRNKPVRNVNLQGLTGLSVVVYHKSDRIIRFDLDERTVLDTAEICTVGR